MPSPSRLLALAALLLLPLSSHPVIKVPPTSLSTTYPRLRPTNDLIAQTVGQVDQKTAPPVDAPPNADVPPTGVTAIDGTITNSTIAEVSAGNSARRRNAGRFGKRQSGFKKIFDGKPADQKDASIEGTAYLTYTVVPQLDLQRDACLNWAAKIDGCVFVNLYYEFNNDPSSTMSSARSLTSKKTNFGGQAILPSSRQRAGPSDLYHSKQRLRASTASSTPTRLMVMSLSSGLLVVPTTLPGTWASLSIEKYDVDACAALCNGLLPSSPMNPPPSIRPRRPRRDPLPRIPPQGPAHRRRFEGYTPPAATYASPPRTSTGSAPAPLAATSTPRSSSSPTTHTTATALPSSARPSRRQQGWHPRARSGTPHDAGAHYVVQAFVSSAFSGPDLEAAAKIEILWNGQSVASKTGFTSGYVFVEASVVAAGNDKLSFAAALRLRWTFIDDVHGPTRRKGPAAQLSRNDGHGENALYYFSIFCSSASCVQVFLALTTRLPLSALSVIIIGLIGFWGQSLAYVLCCCENINCAPSFRSERARLEQGLGVV
ncbi:hypothetical protein B0H14DRAFT_3175732 [Mycena olivaceomarginata]|nr:hypothetical protein B0H14DRAFT_3175732 [Mycena olivaceomarginata]